MGALLRREARLLLGEAEDGGVDGPRLEGVALRLLGEPSDLAGGVDLLLLQTREKRDQFNELCRQPLSCQSGLMAWLR